MFTLIGGYIGSLYCLCSLVFRWKVVVAKYGSLSLYWWLLAITTSGMFLGLLADNALWGVQYAFWEASN